MEKPSAIRRQEEATSPLAVHSEVDPVLLALPPRRMDGRLEAEEAAGEAFLEELQIIETGCGPKIETALLMDLLSRSPGLEKALVDPAEVHGYPNPLAAVNAYKHRLHAVRCEFVNVRLQMHELETELNQSRYRNEVLEKNVQFLNATLAEMQSSRAWKWVEKCSRWRRILVQWRERFCRIACSFPSRK